jgi:hypothetical protein
VAGKGGVLYLVDRDHMGHWQPASDSHAVQTVDLKNGVFGSMTYWNHYVYVLSDSDALRQLEVKDGRLALKAATGNKFPGVSATPTLSANGNRDGVVWVLNSKLWNGFDRSAILYAYDANDVSHELYDSEKNPPERPRRPGFPIQHSNRRGWARVCGCKARGRRLWLAAGSERRQVKRPAMQRTMGKGQSR